MLLFVLSDANRPFAIAIATMLGFGAIELLLALGGLGLTGLLDSLMPDDWDAGVDTDGAPDAGTSVGLASALGFFGIGRVPLMVVVVAFLSSFGLAGFAEQAAASGLTGHYLPAGLASLPAAVAAVLATRRIALLLGRLIPDVETSAVGSDTFIGRTAVLTLGEARLDKPAQGKLRDQNGQIHYVMIEPDQPDGVFREGDRVFLVGRDSGVFKAIAVPSTALDDQDQH